MASGRTYRIDDGRKGLAVLGSTGSIGRNTLEVVRRHPERFRVVSLCAGTNITLLKEQIQEFKPEFVSVLTRESAEELRREYGGSVRVGYGMEGTIEAGTYESVDLTVSAISGASGLVPTISAIRAGKDIALANKETLVMAGYIVMEEARRRKVRLLPVDSEHSAIFQALAGHRKEDIKRIILTASGGPFLRLPLKSLEKVTPDEALRHPNWRMGKKITIDSATLMNKGLEVIEARWLFDVSHRRIEVFIHPQSVVHSMVEYIDGSIVAQMGSADMRGPIAYALSYPERIESGVHSLDLINARFEFMSPEKDRFPCLELAYMAIERGGGVPAVLNAADEVAVDSFLEGRIGFTDIYRVIREVLEMDVPSRAQSIEDILNADLWARRKAEEVIRGMG